jgi:hypothetical protein
MKRNILALALTLIAASTYSQEGAADHGWIEDGLVCAPGTSSTDVKKNLSSGTPYVFVDDISKSVWRIGDPDVVKGHEGHHIAISGSMDKVAMTTHINHLTMLKNQKPGPAPEAVGR